MKEDQLPEISGFDEFDQVIGITLADAIREGSQTTTQVCGWGDMKTTGCAMTAAAKLLNEKGYEIT